MLAFWKFRVEGIHPKANKAVASPFIARGFGKPRAALGQRATTQKIVVALPVCSIVVRLSAGFK